MEEGICWAGREWGLFRVLLGGQQCMVREGTGCTERVAVILPSAVRHAHV